MGGWGGGSAFGGWGGEGGEWGVGEAGFSRGPFEDSEGAWDEGLGWREGSGWADGGCGADVGEIEWWGHASGSNG